VGLALYAQFGPGKFPANYSSTLYCVVGYCVVSVVLSIFSYFKEGDSFMITHPKPVRGG
jgi:signal peptidase complex subunit 2